MSTPVSLNELCETMNYLLIIIRFLIWSFLAPRFTFTRLSKDNSQIAKSIDSFGAEILYRVNNNNNNNHKELNRKKLGRQVGIMCVHLLIWNDM